MTGPERLWKARDRMADVWFEDDIGKVVLTPPPRNLPDLTSAAPRVDQEAVLRSVIRDTCSAYGYTRDSTFEVITAAGRRGFTAAVEEVPEEDLSDLQSRERRLRNRSSVQPGGAGVLATFGIPGGKPVTRPVRAARTDAIPPVDDAKPRPRRDPSTSSQAAT